MKMEIHSSSDMRVEDMLIQRLEEKTVMMFRLDVSIRGCLMVSVLGGTDQSQRC